MISRWNHSAAELFNIRHSCSSFKKSADRSDGDIILVITSFGGESLEPLRYYSLEIFRKGSYLKLKLHSGAKIKLHGRLRIVGWRHLSIFEVVADTRFGIYSDRSAQVHVYTDTGIDR